MKLIIEVTRKCNLNCDHCLRGCSQNMDMKKEYIDELFKQLSKAGIDCLDLTLTGGEPSLNIPMINYTIEKLENSNITLSMFYIATNGINNNNIDFIIPCIKLYNLASEKDLCSVQTSSDIQHTYYMDDTFTDSLMNALKFASKRDEDRNYMDGGAIDQGNASFNCPNAREEIVYDWIENIEDTIFYLNCNGMIINGCDWSYDTQDDNPDVQICRVDEFAKTLKDNIPECQLQYI